MAGPTTLADVTIVEVARLAGVSISTVSRVLNERQDVAAATRRKVRAAIDQLAFVPAGGGARGAVPERVVSVLIPEPQESESGVGSEFILGAARAIGERGYLLNLVVGPMDRDRLARLCRAGRADGLVLAQSLPQDSRFAVLRDHRIPFVAVGHVEAGRPIDEPAVNFVDSAVDARIAALFGYLASLGHRRVALLARARTRLQAGHVSAERQNAGIRDAAQRTGLDLLLLRGELDVAGAARAAAHALDDAHPPSAIVTVNRLGVGGVMRTLHGRGLAAPRDLSVAAMCEDWFAETVVPPLTNVRSGASDLGYQAASMLFRRIEEAEDGLAPHTERVVLHPVLTVRESTAPPR